MEGYAGKQFVGIDLHRRRTVIVRTTEGGEVLETVRIVNDVERLASVMARAGECPEVVLEATYGWYWAVDALQAGGASVHLAHPLGVKAFEYRRVKNDVRDASDLADLLRMGRLPEAWIAPPATRELRELVRHAPSWSGCVHTPRPRSMPCWPSTDYDSMSRVLVVRMWICRVLSCPRVSLPVLLLATIRLTCRMVNSCSSPVGRSTVVSPTRHWWQRPVSSV